MGATSGHPTTQPYNRASLLAKLTGAATLAVGAFLIGQGTSQLASTGSALTYSGGVFQVAGSVPGTPGAGQTLIGGGAGKFGGGITCTTLTANNASGAAPSIVAVGAATTQGWIGLGSSLHGIQGGPDYTGLNIRVNGSTRIYASDDGQTYIYGSAPGTPGATEVRIGAGQIKAGGNCFVGTGSANTQLTIDGVNSGTGVGAILAIKNAGAGGIYIGNFSAIHGGAYDGGGALWAATTLRLGASSAPNIVQLDYSGSGRMGFFGATPVLQATGFGTPTGASRLSNFPGATATLAQCSGAIADLIAYFKSRGDFGA